MWRLILIAGGLVIVGCATTSKPQRDDRTISPEAVLGVAWEWEATDTPNESCPVQIPERYTLHFLPDGKLQVRFDCNTGGGTYAISVGTLSFGPLISTRKACPPDSLDGQFMKQLQQVVGFFVLDDKLYLELSGDNGIMRFRHRG